MTWLNLTKIDDFVEAGLHEALTSIIDRIHRVGETIHRTYFDQRGSLTPAESPQPQSKKQVPAGTGPPATERPRQTAS